MVRAANLEEAIALSPRTTTPRPAQWRRAAILGQLPIESLQDGRLLPALLSSDADERHEAAQAVFKSREENSLLALETAIDKETSPRIKQTLTEARAAIILNSDGARTKSAIEVIRIRGDQDAVALLSALPAEAPPSVARLAAAAAASVTGNLELRAAAQNAWFGISLGSSFLLATFGVTAYDRPREFRVIYRWLSTATQRVTAHRVAPRGRT
jgi:hypothetical protein